MSKNVNVNGVDYSGVSEINLNTTDGGTAQFRDVDEITTPSGTKEITENGVHDVTDFASVAVNVPTDGASGGASGEWEEVYSNAITGAANLIPISYDSAWDEYTVLAMVFDGVTLSASDYVRVAYDNTAINRAGFYPTGNVKATEANAECVLFIRANSVCHRVNDDNSNKLKELASLSTINIFATTSTTNITGGTIKIKGLR